MTRQEYYVKTGILSEDKNIMTRQEYYVKTGILSEDKNTMTRQEYCSGRTRKDE
jgi:hypothetical protein